MEQGTVRDVRYVVMDRRREPTLYLTRCSWTAAPVAARTFTSEEQARQTVDSGPLPEFEDGRPPVYPDIGRISLTVDVLPGRSAKLVMLNSWSTAVFVRMSPDPDGNFRLRMHRPPCTIAARCVICKLAEPER